MFSTIFFSSGGPPCLNTICELLFDFLDKEALQKWGVLLQKKPLGEQILNTLRVAPNEMGGKKKW